MIEFLYQGLHFCYGYCKTSQKNLFSFHHVVHLLPPSALSPFLKNMRFCCELCFTLQQCCSWFLSFSRLLIPSLSATGQFHFLISLVVSPKQKLYFVQSLLTFGFVLLLFSFVQCMRTSSWPTVTFHFSSLSVWICFQYFDLKWDICDSPFHC